MDDRQLAQCYDEKMLPVWDQLFVEVLLPSFPRELAPGAKLLEIGCATGRMTEEIVARLPAGGELTAVEDVGELMEIARGKVGAFERQKVLFKQARADKLSFADEMFEGVLCAGLATAYDLEAVLSEVTRLLGPRAFVLMGVALQGSFQELLDIFREVAEREDLVEVLDGLDRLSQRLPDRKAVLRMLSDAGLVECRVGAHEHSVRFGSARELLQAPVVRQHCLDSCLALIADRSWREGMLAGMVSSLDTYFPSGVELTLHLGTLEGIKR